MALLKSAAAKLPEISLSIQLLLVLTILLFFILVIVIRRVFFHPLSGYPGPWLAAVTCWHPAYYAWKGTLHAYNRRCHDRYGPVFRSSVNELSFETPKGLDDIYTGSHEVIGKPDRWQCFSVDPREPTILSTVNNEQHRFKHQIISKIFASGMTSRNEARMRPHIDRFLEQLGAGDHDVQDLCDWLSLDIISDLLYGESLSLLCSAEYRWVGPAYRHMSRWIMTCIVQPRFRWLIYLHQIIPSFGSIIKLGRWTRFHLIQRLEKSVERKDFLALLRPTGGENNTYTKKGLWTESVLLLAAGSDTTSTTMAALFFYLVHHPESLARVTMDVRGVFKDEGEITSGPKLASCIYLRACIRETMRLVPAVPNLSPRIVLAETAEIDGRVVPKNTNVGVSLSSYNQSPASFDRANEFRPERWIPADGKQLNLKLFRSFGEGPRRCVGMHLALLELELVIARAVFRYDVLVPPEGLSNQKTQRAERAHHEFAFDAWAVASGRAGQISSDCFVKKDQRR